MSNKKIDDMMENIVMSDELKDKIRKQTIEKGRVVKFKKNSIKKVALVACLSVAMLGTMTVVGNNLDKIENYFAGIFNMDEETQKKLQDGGYIQNMNVDDGEDITNLPDDSGVKLTLKETLADKRSINALVSLKTKDKIESRDYMAVRNIFGSFDSGSLILCDEVEAADNEVLFFVEMHKTEGEGYKNGETVELILEDLVTYDADGKKLCKMEEDSTFVLNDEEYKIVMVSSSAQMHDRVIIKGLDGFDYYVECVSTGEAYNGSEYEFYIDGNDEESYLWVEGYDVVICKGQWKLNWELTANDECLDFAINEEIEANGYKYYIRNIQLSSFSIDINYYDRALAIDEEYIWENASLDEGEYAFYEQLEAEGEIPEPPYIPLNVQVVMKDGSVRDLKMMGDSLIGHSTEWYELGYIGEILDLENIEKIIVEGHEYFVER